MNYCAKHTAPLYEIAAVATNRQNQSVIDRLHYLDDDATDKIPLLLQFYMGMPIMVTKRLKELEKVSVDSASSFFFSHTA